VLGVTCSAHVLHDGFTDLLYLLLPIWQAEFGLSLAQVGLLKTCFSGALASLQMPSGLLGDRLGERALLALGTAVVAAGYALVAWVDSFIGLIACLLLAGAGASVQHPIGSSLTARAFEGVRQRAALSTYNFSGDLGKMLLPAITAWLIALWQWRAAVTLLGAVALAAALVLFAVLRPRPAAPSPAHADSATPVKAHLAPETARRGFAALSAIGIIDSTARGGFLTFLPFLLIAKGASLPLIGTALTLIFAGGAAGKFVCGLLATRFGVLRTVILTEGATAVGIFALLPLPLEWAMVLLPAIGVALNGTSSVLYGTVAELAPVERRARAFGFFYTVTIGASAVAPLIYGLISDAIGVPQTLMVVAGVVLLTVPLTLPLRPALRVGPVYKVA
jgi:MFS family permease